ncbi:MAG: glutaminyl-peptide cyclotransferase [Pseudonocardiaceae bacterium]
MMTLAACSGRHPSGAEQLHVQILATLPHDTTMYTEGLEIHDGVLYEGSGLVGQSRLRATRLSGNGLMGSSRREVALPDPLFGEGLTVAGDRLWQLTWTNGVAIERDPATLAQRRRVEYQGEGWGLCYDGHRLVMSNGSDRLTFRDPVTFAPSGRVEVRLDGEPVRQLNELECAGGAIWANVFERDRILRINPSTGAVTGVVDAAGLFTGLSDGDVLNGIAAIPGTDEFLITGKHWPSLYRVRFSPSPGRVSAATSVQQAGDSRRGAPARTVVGG